MTDFERQLRKRYNVIATAAESVLSRILLDLREFLQGVPYVDTPSGRVKSKESFVAKVLRDPDKYNPPFQRVEDLIGLRVPVYFSDTSKDVYEKLRHGFFSNVEDSHKNYESGYEGFHLIQSIPLSFLPQPPPSDFPVLIEIQVRTLFLHAWAQPEHLFRYKNDLGLRGDNGEIDRRLKELSELSRRSDRILMDLKGWYERTKSDRNSEFRN